MQLHKISVCYEWPLSNLRLSRVYEVDKVNLLSKYELAVLPRKKRQDIETGQSD